MVSSEINPFIIIIIIQKIFAAIIVLCVCVCMFI